MIATDDLLLPDGFMGSEDIQSWNGDYQESFNNNNGCDLLEFDWGSMTSSPTTTIDSVASTPQWSMSTDENEEPSAKRSKKEEKLAKNKEAAARCRLKRKKEQTEIKKHVEDLENQLHLVRVENDALTKENLALRAENSSLKDEIAKFALENKATISGVAVFGVICLFPLYSSTPESEYFSSIVNSFHSILEGAVGMGQAHGRVLLSDDDMTESLLTGSMDLLWRGLWSALVIGSFLYVAAKVFFPPTPDVSDRGEPVLPRVLSMGSTSDAKDSSSVAKFVLRMPLLSSSLIRLWLHDQSDLPM